MYNSQYQTSKTKSRLLVFKTRKVFWVRWFSFFSFYSHFTVYSAWKFFSLIFPLFKPLNISYGFLVNNFLSHSKRMLRIGFVISIFVNSLFFVFSLRMFFVLFALTFQWLNLCVRFLCLKFMNFSFKRFQNCEDFQYHPTRVALKHF